MHALFCCESSKYWWSSGSPFETRVYLIGFCQQLLELLSTLSSESNKSPIYRFFGDNDYLHLTYNVSCISKKMLAHFIG